MTGDPSAPAVATIGGAALEAHDHLCLVYDSDSRRDRVIVEFLAEGLRAGHKCFCLAAATDQFRIAAKVAAQPEVAWPNGDESADGILEFGTPNHSYLHGGGFSSHRMLQYRVDWAVTAYDRQRRTFARIVTDMTWAYPFLTPDFADDLVRYEARFALWAQTHPQVTACMYDTRKFPDDLLLRISKVHSKLWIDGEVMENPFHVDLAHILGREQ
jgi:hypothetical protein